MLGKSRNFGDFVTISRTVLYFTGIFMLNGKQLLNKNDTQIFLKNVCLLSG